MLCGLDQMSRGRYAASLWLLMVAQGNIRCLYIFGCVQRRLGGRTVVMAVVGIMVGGAALGDSHLFLCMAGPVCACVCESLCTV